MKIYRTRFIEEYDWLMQKLEDEGYEWNGGTKPTESEDGREYANEVVIYLEANKRLTWDFVKDVDGKNISRIIEVSELMAEPDPLAKKIEERDHKSTFSEAVDEAADILVGDPIEPQHYRKGEIDLFESWYRTRPFNEFRAIMESIAERYMKRDKENRVEDISKAIYTLERLKEYEENTNEKDN